MDTPISNHTKLEHIHHHCLSNDPFSLTHLPALFTEGKERSGTHLSYLVPSGIFILLVSQKLPPISQKQSPFVLEVIRENNGLYLKKQYLYTRKDDCISGSLVPWLRAVRWRSELVVPFVLLQPLVQCLGLGVEAQGQFNVAVRFHGIEAKHVS